MGGVKAIQTFKRVHTPSHTLHPQNAWWYHCKYVLNHITLTALYCSVLSNEDYTDTCHLRIQGCFSCAWYMVRVNTHAALKGYPKADLCATSKLCQYSSGTNAVWHNRTLRHRTRRDNGRTAHSYFRPDGRTAILRFHRLLSQKSGGHIAQCCAIVWLLKKGFRCRGGSTSPTRWVLC